MKEFDLEAVKSGSKICTRDGHPARILYFDYEEGEDYPIIARITCNDDNTTIKTYTIGGKFFKNNISEHDLMIAETTSVIEKYKNYHFEPFEKVLVRDFDEEVWNCSFFSTYTTIESERLYCCIHRIWNQCIPYNEETKHLLGTTSDEL